MPDLTSIGYGLLSNLSVSSSCARPNERSDSADPILCTGSLINIVYSSVFHLTAGW